MQYSSISSDKDETLLIHEAEIALGLEESKSKYRKITQACIAQFVRDFQAGEIKINSFEDFERIVKLDLDLQRDEF